MQNQMFKRLWGEVVEPVTQPLTRSLCRTAFTKQPEAACKQPCEQIKTFFTKSWWLLEQ